MAGHLWVWVSLSITKLVSTKVEIVYPTTFFEVHSIGLVLLGGQLQKINNLEVDRMSLNNTKLETPKIEEMKLTQLGDHGQMPCFSVAVLVTDSAVD